MFQGFRRVYPRFQRLSVGMFSALSFPVIMSLFLMFVSSMVQNLQRLQIWHVCTELARWTECTQQKVTHSFWFYLFRLLGWGDDLWSPHRTQKRWLGGWLSQRGALSPGSRKWNQNPWNNMDQAEKSGCCLSVCLFLYLSFIHWRNNAICPVNFFFKIYYFILVSVVVHSH